VVKRITNNAFIWIVLLGLGTGCGTTNKKPPAPPTKDDSSLSEVAPTETPPSRTGNPESYVVFGKRYHVDKTSEGYLERGTASWYGSKFHGRKTSSGAIFNMYDITAAHRTLPIPSYARVTHLDNGRSLIVKINDRGPFAHNRIIDLSYAAAKKLGIIKNGTAKVEVLALPPYQYLQGHRKPRPMRVNSKPAAPPVQPMATPTQRAVNSQPVFIQVGAFSNRDNAELLKNRLMNHLNHPVRIESSENQWYKVRVGPLADPAEAQQIAGRLNGLGIDSQHFIFD
jgi:rare lipoprotein A